MLVRVVRSWTRGFGVGVIDAGDVRGAPGLWQAPRMNEA